MMKQELEEEVETLLSEFRVFDTHETQIRERALRFIKSQGIQALTPNLAGEFPHYAHFTVAAWIFDSSQSQVLLTKSAKENRWKLPSSHGDGENSLLQIATSCASRALNFLVEPPETALFGIGEYQIEEYWNTPSHLHFELVFRFEAAKTVALPRGARWFKKDEAARLADENIARCFAKTLN